MNNNSIELHDQIRMAINKSSYTTHAFAQQMNIKLSTLESLLLTLCRK